jgi:hypothetical protein
VPEDLFASAEWVAVTKRNARSVQTLIGWIFWDPGAVSRYEELGLNGPLGYLASRAAPFAGAGARATTAAFGSISPAGIELVFAHLGAAASFVPFWRARDAAVLDGLAAFAPDARDGLAKLEAPLWRVVEQLPAVGRPFFASHLELERPTSTVLRGWHAVNCLREWRGDTHWAIVASVGLSGPEASILHNGWLGYDGDWLSTSRGNSPESIDLAWRQLEAKALANDRTVNDAGLQLRQWIEDETDRRTTLPWELAGGELAHEFHDLFEPPCALLLARVDETAGVNYQPASRVRPGRVES